MTKTYKITETRLAELLEKEADLGAFGDFPYEHMMENIECDEDFDLDTRSWTHIDKELAKFEEVNPSPADSKKIEHIIYDWVADNFDVGEAQIPSWDIRELSEHIAHNINTNYVAKHELEYENE